MPGPAIGDPCCGTGRFLIAAINELKLDPEDPRRHALLERGPLGVDQSASAVSNARINRLLLAGTVARTSALVLRKQAATHGRIFLARAEHVGYLKQGSTSMPDPGRLSCPTTAGPCSARASSEYSYPTWIATRPWCCRITPWFARSWRHWDGAPQARAGELPRRTFCERDRGGDEKCQRGCQGQRPRGEAHCVCIGEVAQRPELNEQRLDVYLRRRPSGYGERATYVAGKTIAGAPRREGLR